MQTSGRKYYKIHKKKQTAELEIIITASFAAILMNTVW